IGFEHDRGQGERARQLTNPARPLEAHRPAETEPKAEVDEHLRLLPAAVVGVGDASTNADATQLLKDRIDRTAYVQDHRQVMTTRELELPDKKIERPRRVHIRNEMVEADLAHCPRRAARKMRLEHVEVVLA